MIRKDDHMFARRDVQYKNDNGVIRATSTVEETFDERSAHAALEDTQRQLQYTRDSLEQGRSQEKHLLEQIQYLEGVVKSFK